ncbi:MAG: hypothetical protein EXR43_01420 [Dehalococcoidia bacterium]|nr:hypothetical protein [Dehalococcoidia bacterium]
MTDIAISAQLDQLQATCRHHWLIGAPEGATSSGRCKRCGEEREFSNSSTDSLWERDGGSGSAAAPLGRSGTLPGPADDGF